MQYISLCELRMSSRIASMSTKRNNQSDLLSDIPFCHEFYFVTDSVMDF